MSEVFLSICIATFRRGAFIGETLRNLLEQATSGVELLVLDGGSPDDTATVVRALQEEYPCLRYIRQERNMGVDRDYNTAVELARGEYCWLMTDDDLVKPGTVRRVLDACRSGYGFVIVNCEVRSIDFSERIEERRLAVCQDREYGPGETESFFAEIAPYLQFIGAVVIRRSIWLARERGKYYGTLFIHVGVIFQAPLPEKAFVISDPLITVRFGNAMWTPRMFEIWNFKWPELVWSFPGYSDASKRKVCAKEPWNRLVVLLLDRAKGVYSTEGYRKWIAPRMKSPLRRLGAALIALIPGCLLNLVGIAWLSFVDRNYPLHLQDLRGSRYYYRNCIPRWLTTGSGTN